MPLLVRIPRKLDSDSRAIWTGIPRESGQSERSDAGLRVFTLSDVLGSSFYLGGRKQLGCFEGGFEHGAELCTGARQAALPQ